MTIFGGKGGSWGNPWISGVLCGLGILSALNLSCKQLPEVNERATEAHARTVVELAIVELSSLRAKVPREAARLSAHWGDGASLVNNLGAARSELAGLRSTRQRRHFESPAYFAIASDGVVVRNDRPVDELAGTDLYRLVPQLRSDSHRYREAIGNLGRLMAPGRAADGQWLAMAGLEGQEGNSKAQLVAGVSLGLLAHRLEKALRTTVRLDRVANSAENMPLLYCFVLVGPHVYAGPLTPAVHSRTIATEQLVQKVSAGTGQVETIVLDQRTYTLAVEPLPQLAANAGVGVLRSET